MRGRVAAPTASTPVARAPIRLYTLFFLLSYFPTPQTPDQYKIEYDSRRGGEYSRFHGYTYDGIWTVALAVKHVARRIRHFHRNQTISDFRYRDVLWEKLFLDALRNTSFDGVTVSRPGSQFRAATLSFAPPPPSSFVRRIHTAPVIQFDVRLLALKTPVVLCLGTLAVSAGYILSSLAAREHV